MTTMMTITNDDGDGFEDWQVHSTHAVPKELTMMNICRLKDNDYDDDDYHDHVDAERTIVIKILQGSIGQQKQQRLNLAKASHSVLLTVFNPVEI